MSRQRTGPRAVRGTAAAPAELVPRIPPPPGWTIEAIKSLLAETFPGVSEQDRLYCALAIWGSALDIPCLQHEETAAAGARPPNAPGQN